MSPRQLIVLVIAAIAAIGVLLVIRGMTARRAAPTAPAAVTEQVLVAAHDIQQGAALAPGDLAVADFPKSSITPNFINITAQPAAQAQTVGAVTRRAFVQGEPITSVAIVQPEGRSFLAAQLTQGFRAIAVQVDAQHGVAGYVQPNDHVDVISTSRQEGDSGHDETHSEIILQDVRVLALDANNQPPTTGDHPEPIDARVAVLELSPEDARTLMLARGMGEISLALRGVQTETAGAGPNNGTGALGQSSGSVRMHAFGRATGGGR